MRCFTDLLQDNSKGEGGMGGRVNGNFFYTSSRVYIVSKTPDNGSHKFKMAARNSQNALPVSLSLMGGASEC